MLPEHEVTAIAESYAAQYYGEAHGGDYTLVKIAEVSDPPGTYFGVTYAPAVSLTGDAGFFVSGSDGRITQLNSGEYFAELYTLSRAALAVTPAEVVRRVMLAKQAGNDAAV